MTTDTGKVERENKQTAVAVFFLTNSTRDSEQGGTFFRDDTRRHNLTSPHSPGVCKIADEPATARGGTEWQIKKAVELRRVMGRLFSAGRRGGGGYLCCISCFLSTVITYFSIMPGTRDEIRFFYL